MTTRTIFGVPEVNLGNGQFIKLSSYEKTSPKKRKYATYKYTMFLDLHTVDVDSEDFLQTSIRVDQILPEHLELIEESLRYYGWDIEEIDLPWMDENGKILGGTHRILTAKKMGWDYLPIDVYHFGDTDSEDVFDRALEDNLKTKPKSDAKMTDIEARGVQRILKERMKAEESEVRNWILSLEGVKGRYSKRHVTKMTKAILRDAASGGSAVILSGGKDPSEHWSNWCKNNVRGDVHVVQAGKDDYIYRLFIRKILNRNTNKPLRIVLYVNTPYPKSARENVKRAEKLLDEIYESAFNMVNENVPRRLQKINTPFKEQREYEILGCIPQIKDVHDTTGTSLVKVSEY